MAAARRHTSAVLNHYNNIGTCPGEKLQWVARWNVVNCPCCKLDLAGKFKLSHTHRTLTLECTW